MDRRVRVSRLADGDVPMIRLRGKWLGAAGFPAGTTVIVTVARGKLVLAAAADRRTEESPPSW